MITFIWEASVLYGCYADHNYIYLYIISDQILSIKMNRMMYIYVSIYLNKIVKNIFFKKQKYMIS